MIFRFLVSVIVPFYFAFAGELLDKSALLFNEKMFTLSELKRMSKTLKFRKEINQFSYADINDSLDSLAESLIQTLIIRDKLSELNVKISDDVVEDKINETLKKSAMSRSELGKMIAAKGIEFEEYFEIIRESIEYKYFISNIITPLIQISESDIRNLYGQKAGAIHTSQLELIDFNFNPANVSKNDLATIGNKIKNYINTGNDKTLPSYETLELGFVDTENLAPEIAAKVKNLKKNDISSGFLDQGRYHFFYVKDIRAGENENYSRVKNDVREYVYAQKASELSKNYFAGEKSKYFIQKNF